MELVPFKSSKITTEQVWAVKEGERRPVAFHHILVMIVMIIVGFVIGAYGSINFPLGFGVNFFWVGIVVQQVGAMWFGAWGVIAGCIFPFFSNAVARAPFYVSLAYIPANAVQAWLPAWAFRQFKLDPRLRAPRDYLILFVTMVVSSAFGALWSTLVVLRSYGLLNTESVQQFVWGWFMGNVIAGLIFNFLVLKVFSGLVIRTKVFVKGWFA
jgi:hypothetical protein